MRSRTASSWIRTVAVPASSPNRSINAVEPSMSTKTTVTSADPSTGSVMSPRRGCQASQEDSRTRVRSRHPGVAGCADDDGTVRSSDWNRESMRMNSTLRRGGTYVGILTMGTMMLVVSATAAGGAARVVRASGELTRYSDPYGTGVDNPIPAGATATVHATQDANGTTIVTLQVRGLPANREFGAHAHVLGCANNKAGGHYQNVRVPIGVPNDSTYANEQNEIWLDFATNAAGNGSATTTVAWTFRIDGA